MDRRYLHAHEVLFDHKRVYWSSQIALSRWLRPFDLTPARLEVLRLVEMGYATQAMLRRALGIARSTMSRMLSAMERRGLIVRTSRAPQRARKHVSVPRRIRALARALVSRAHPVFAKRLRKILGCTRSSTRAYAGRVSRLIRDLAVAREDLGDRGARRAGDRPPAPSPPRRRDRFDRISWLATKRYERLEARARVVEEREAAREAKWRARGEWDSGAPLTPSIFFGTDSAPEWMRAVLEPR